MLDYPKKDITQYILPKRRTGLLFDICYKTLYRNICDITISVMGEAYDPVEITFERKLGWNSLRMGEKIDLTKKTLSMPEIIRIAYCRKHKSATIRINPPLGAIGFWIEDHLDDFYINWVF